MSYSRPSRICGLSSGLIAGLALALYAATGLRWPAIALLTGLAVAVVVAREMTKLHEEFHRGTIASAHAWYAAIAERDGKLRGEFAVVIAPLDAATLEQREGEAAAVAEERATEAVRARLAAGGALSRVVKEAALEFGVPKAKLYAEALRQKEALRGVRESKE
jgi:16S rRNA (cytidine1402-2'-O)-methyltransferase